MRTEDRHETLSARLRSPAPRVREAAARAVAEVVWAPEAERALASALAEAVVLEEDAQALAAQIDALSCVEPDLDDRELDRLGFRRSQSPALARLLARAARLQVCEPPEPLADATRVIVRTLGGVPHRGLALRTPLGARVVLERIEFARKEVGYLSPGMSGRLTLSGPGARDLAYSYVLDAAPGPRRYAPRLRSPDPRVRQLAAAEASDWPDSWQPEVGRYLCGALAMAAVRERDPAALEAELHALIQLGAHLAEPALAVLRTLDRAALPEALREYLDDLLEQAPR